MSAFLLTLSLVSVILSLNLSQECNSTFPYSFPYYYENIDVITESDRFEMEQIVSLTVTLIHDLQTLKNCQNVENNWKYLLETYYDIDNFVFHVIETDQFINFTSFRDDWTRKRNLGPLNRMVYRSYDTNDQEEIVIVSSKSSATFDVEQLSDNNVVNYVQNEFTFIKSNSTEYKWKLRLWKSMRYDYGLNSMYNNNIKDVGTNDIQNIMIITMIIMALMILILFVLVFYSFYCKKEEDGSYDMFSARYDSVQTVQTQQDVQ